MSIILKHVCALCHGEVPVHGNLDRELEFSIVCLAVSIEGLNYGVSSSGS